MSERMSEPELSFILATYNEKDTIVALVERVLRVLGNYELEIILVDDSSPDGTAQLVRNIGDPRVVILERRRGRGLASAYMRGIIESRGKVLCWMDADGCMPVEMIPEMISRLQEADAVVGSRFVNGGRDDRDFIRVFTSKLIIWFARTVLNCRTRDIDSGFMVLKRECLDGTLFSPTGYGEYFIELIANLERKKYKVVEMGYAFRDRDVDEGQSKSFNGWLRFLKLGFKYGLRVLRCRIWPLDK